MRGMFGFYRASGARKMAPRRSHAFISASHTRQKVTVVAAKGLRLKALSQALVGLVDYDAHWGS